jgi:hypothetical protein
MEYLYEMNQKWQMIRYGPMPWLTCSPDFDLLVCYLLGYLKSYGIPQRSSVKNTSGSTEVTEIAADVRIGMAAHWPMLSKADRFEIIFILKPHIDVNKC